MAINLTYDTSDDPEAIDQEDQRDLESLDIADKLQEEEQGLLAGKYKDAEELEKAYLELQQKLGSKNDDDESDITTTEDTKDTETPEDFVDPFEDDATANVLFQASNEYNETGEVSAETMETINQMSSSEVVEAYKRIQEELNSGKYDDYRSEDTPDETTYTESEPLTDESIDAIHNAVGGEDAYKRMVGWASDNFTQQEIEAYDQTLESGNLSSINLALQALYYRYQDAVGYEGDMIQGKSASTVDAFRSQAEVVRAMDEPRYENDPAYRQDVYNKLERSQLQF